MDHDAKRIRLWCLLSVIGILGYGIVPAAGSLWESSSRSFGIPLFLIIVVSLLCLPTLMSLLCISFLHKKENFVLFLLIWLVQLAGPITLFTANDAEDWELRINLWYCLHIAIVTVILWLLLLLPKQRNWLLSILITGCNLGQLFLFCLLPE